MTVSINLVDSELLFSIFHWFEAFISGQLQKIKYVAI